ncbi:hypothetical protein BDR26DRAFT_863271 [Obelidium mucronatum]|nr:hypothetical protein BDR26DRAFT_863271 [Obelidium mucronatum]
MPNFATWKLKLDRNKGYSPTAVVGRLLDQWDLARAKQQLAKYQHHAEKLTKQGTPPSKCGLDLSIVKEAGMKPSSNCSESGVALNQVLLGGSEQNTNPPDPAESETTDKYFVNASVDGLPLSPAVHPITDTSPTKPDDEELQQNNMKTYMRLVFDGKVRYLQKEVEVLEQTVQENRDELKARPLFKDTRIALVAWKNQTLGIKPYIQPENVKSILKVPTNRKKWRYSLASEKGKLCNSQKITFSSEVEEIVFESEEFVDEELDFCVQAYA